MYISENDLKESLKSLAPVARRTPRKENQDNVHESDANENSYSAGSTSKATSSKHSLRHSDILVYSLLINPLSANPTKGLNTLKQFIGSSRRIV